MPTYEYACKACEERLEVVQSFTDDALTTCPACGGALRKIFGSIGISFKGSGFYKTDSRATSSASTKPDSAKDGSSKSDSSNSGGAEKKTDAPAKESSTPKADAPKSEKSKPTTKAAAAS